MTETDLSSDTEAIAHIIQNHAGGVSMTTAARVLAKLIGMGWRPRNIGGFPRLSWDDAVKSVIARLPYGQRERNEDIASATAILIALGYRQEEQDD